MSKKLLTDDLFYENLTLGLSSALAQAPRIRNVTWEKREPCDKSQLMAWEQRNSVYLPEDMKKFFLSTDGFYMHWSYQYSPNDLRRVGFIYIPRLNQITLLNETVSNGSVDRVIDSAAGDQCPTQSPGTSLVSNQNLIGSKSTAVTYNGKGSQVSSSAADVGKDAWGNALPNIGPKTKIFEMSTVNGMAKVCLIYESNGSNNPKVYLLELRNLKWVFLADTFSEYMRMSITHLGLPYWELCFASCGLPAWTKQLFLLLAPHLLEEHEERRSRVIAGRSEQPYNTLDTNVFRFKAKGNTFKSNSSTKPQ